MRQRGWNKTETPRPIQAPPPDEDLIGRSEVNAAQRKRRLTRIDRLRMPQPGAGFRQIKEADLGVCLHASGNGVIATSSSCHFVAPSDGEIRVSDDRWQDGTEIREEKEGNEGFKNNHSRSIGRRIHRNLKRSQRAPERKKGQRVTDPNQKNHQLGLQETEAAMHFHLYGKGAINYHDSSFRMFFHLLLCFLPYPNLGPLQIWVNAQDWAKSGEAGESPILFLSFSGMGLVVHGLFFTAAAFIQYIWSAGKNVPPFPDLQYILVVPLWPASGSGSRASDRNA